MNGESPTTKPPRLVDAMPRPVMIVFVVAALVALSGIVIGLTRPPQRIALEDRRPPPRNGYTHFAGVVAPLPVPSPVPSVAPACPAVARTHVVAGGDGVARISSSLARVCELSEGGVSAAVAAGLGALEGATVRFATFASTGVDSTTDVATRTVWLNSRFALHKVPPVNLAPLIVQEGHILASLEQGSSAARELAARRVELEVCKALIDIRRWPPGCKDADTFARMDELRALALLRSAGFD